MDFGRKDGYSTTLYMRSTTGDYQLVGPAKLTYTTEYIGKTIRATSMRVNQTLMSYKKVDKYIINECATIIFWNDGSKTISKRDKEDKFDKELGFLFAYFYGKYKGSKTSMKRVLDTIDYNKIKTFLFEFYVNDIGENDYNKARNYLKNLKVENK